MFSARLLVPHANKLALRPQLVRINIKARMTSTGASTGSISAAITKDHRELEQYYNEIVNNPNNKDHIERYGNQFTWELARHSVAEELLIYPAMEKFMGEKGKALAENDREQHHQVRSFL